ncbi:hypothetical protein NDU88_003804 [Pleurodeles waltl]|uniref:Uncharacterized protein n=1 Tax=Pleurodeles waltl TaxID=8319 RepID=A0AAV7T7S8_PLEWA|nr:hypothetical protein NDU88_003804 [Pleurodeles waltl]
MCKCHFHLDDLWIEGRVASSVRWGMEETCVVPYCATLPAHARDHARLVAAGPWERSGKVRTRGQEAGAGLAGPAQGAAGLA